MRGFVADFVEFESHPTGLSNAGPNARGFSSRITT
jgi:hypothetical protein